MKTLDMAKATAPLAEYAHEAKREPVIVTRAGKPFAAVVSIENADMETVTLSTDPQFIALIERSRARQRAEGSQAPQCAVASAPRAKRTTRNE